MDRRQGTTDPVLLNLMLLQMVVSAFWFTSSVVPLSTNQHQRSREPYWPPPVWRWCSPGY